MREKVGDQQTCRSTITKSTLSGYRNCSRIDSDATVITRIYSGVYGKLVPDLLCRPVTWPKYPAADPDHGTSLFNGRLKII
jgi:hypothetical protein